jgi:hypothetical protein
MAEAERDDARAKKDMNYAAQWSAKRRQEFQKLMIADLEEERRTDPKGWEERSKKAGENSTARRYYQQVKGLTQPSPSCDGIEIPAGTQFSVDVRLLGSARDILLRRVIGLAYMTLTAESAGGIYAVHDGERMVRLKRLRLDRGGAVTVQAAEAMGKLAKAENLDPVDGAVALIGILRVLGTGGLDQRMPVMPHIIHQVAVETLQQQLNQPQAWATYGCSYTLAPRRARSFTAPQTQINENCGRVESTSHGGHRGRSEDALPIKLPCHRRRCYSPRTKERPARPMSPISERAASW